MHLKDEILRAFMDGELAAAERKTATEHLADCAKCSARLSEMETIALRTSSRLGRLAPAPREPLPSAHTALRAFDKRKEQPMKTIFRRPAWVAAGVALVLALSLIFPPVRALAGSFLGLFRVQQVQVLSFDPAALERYNNNENMDLVQAFFNENMTSTPIGEFTQAGSKEEAAALAGFTPRLPANAEINSLGVQPGETIEINIDSATMNAGLESFGYTSVTIPADLDGQKITATIPMAITTSIGECPADSEVDAPDYPACINMIQLPAPTVSAPDSFPVAQLGEVVLQLIGMSPEQAAAYSQSVDWSSTLILPIPTGSNVHTSTFTVDGVQGTYVWEQETDRYTLIWVKNGILYGITGMSSIEPAERLIATLE